MTSSCGSRVSLPESELQYPLTRMVRLGTSFYRVLNSVQQQLPETHSTGFRVSIHQAAHHSQTASPRIRVLENDSALKSVVRRLGKCACLTADISDKSSAGRGKAMRRESMAPSKLAQLN